MRGSPGLRFALALPVGSPRSIVAATQVVIFLVREVGKTELDLSDRGPRLPPATTRSVVGTVLFAAVLAEWVLDDAASAHLEAEIRQRIERYYARQGIAPVYYDLQRLARGF